MVQNIEEDQPLRGNRLEDKTKALVGPLKRTRAASSKRLDVWRVRTYVQVASSKKRRSCTWTQDELVAERLESRKESIIVHPNAMSDHGGSAYPDSVRHSREGTCRLDS